MREPAKNSTTAVNRRQAGKAMAAFVIAPSLLKPVPFVMKPMPEGLDAARLKAKTFFDPLEVLRAYRTALLKADGSLFLGPAIERVTETDDSIVFKVQDCEIKEVCNVRGIRLFAPDGEPRGDYGFYQFQHVMPGDTLKVTITAGVSHG